MFNIGPMELLVLAVVGLIVLGPDRLPGLARDAARMIRTLRELATGAREQLRNELGPEFADVDLSSLNPRTAIQRAVLGDDVDLSALNPRTAIQRAMFDANEPPAPPGESAPSPVHLHKPAAAPRPEPGAPAPFDPDTT